MAVTDRVHDLVAPLVEDEGAELYDVTQEGPVLRVAVDRRGGVDLETISRLTRRISRALDDDDAAGPGGRYTLEVSSPGLERPLRTVDHYRRAEGETVKIKTRPGVEPRRVEGVLRGVDGDGDAAEALVEDDDGVHRIRLGDVSRARTTFEWGPAPKPSRTRKANR